MSKKKPLPKPPLSSFTTKELLEELRVREAKILAEVEAKQIELNKAATAVSVKLKKATELSGEVASIVSNLNAKPILPKRENGKDEVGLLQRIVNILSCGKCMGVGEICGEAIRTGWVSNSKTKRNIVSSTLSINKDLFERVAHGTYRLRVAPQAPKNIDLDLERANG